MPKLTKPQWFLLADIVNGDGSSVREYLPARKLVALGLAQWRCGYYFLEPTEAGRAAIADGGRDG